MGQTLRRAIGRVRPSRVDPPLPPAQRPARPSAAADPPSPAASSADAPDQLGVPDAGIRWPCLPYTYDTYQLFFFFSPYFVDAKMK